MQMQAERARDVKLPNDPNPDSEHPPDAQVLPFAAGESG